MDINEISNEKYSAIIVTELKAYGVKCQKEKKKKYIKEKDSLRKIFCTHLHLLDLTDVVLANGKAVKIPTFVKVACDCVLEQVDTEGLFRKAGSIARQREIRTSLESGEPLGKHHHVIDIANVIKYFFRELPLPLISPCVQEALLQCLLVRENSIECMLLACLLLPLLTINTLSFFMQFLHTVSLSENRNKMTVQNLAIVFTPALMPFPNIKSQRYMNHVKIVRILIENANSIGVIPSRIEQKLLETTKKLSSVESLNGGKRRSRNNIPENNGSVPVSTKKKRRSDLFHGLRKIVGSTMGSTELLDCSLEGNRTKFINPLNNLDHLMEAGKSVFKEGKKRKLLETDSVFKSKKKDAKKTRLSFSGEQNKNSSLGPVATSVERRWSIVGSTCSKYKNKNESNKKCSDNSNCQSDSGFSSSNDVIDGKYNLQLGGTSPLLTNRNCEFTQIEEKETAIEHRIAKESTPMEDPRPQNVYIVDEYRTPDHVQAKLKKMPSETQILASPVTEELVQCLSHKLHVMKNTNQSGPRSLNDRKTETILQGSQDNRQKSSWHIQLLQTSPRKPKPVSTLKAESQSFISSKTINLENSSNSCKRTEDLTEQWLPGEEFFTKVQSKKLICPKNDNEFNSVNFEHVATPSRHKIKIDTDKTPMLPPKSLPIKVSNMTPSGNVGKPATATKLSSFRRVAVSTPDIEEINGRASIARLREQNAGMVMAKAKLFDSLETKISNRGSKSLEKKSAKSPHKIKSGNAKCDAQILENSERCENRVNFNERNCLQPTFSGERIQCSGSNTPVSASKQRQRNVSKLPSKHLMKSIVSQDKLTKHATGNFEITRKISKVETVKTSNNCRNPKSPRRPRKQY